MSEQLEADGTSKREVPKKIPYVPPAILTFGVVPSFASAHSNREGQ